MNDIQQRQAQAQPQVQRQIPQTQVPKSGRDIKKLKKLILALLVVLVVTLIGLFIWRNYFGGNGVKKNQYQAVFMTNGQAYIGRLQNSPKSEYLKLTDVYTIQVQAQDGTDAAKTDAATQQPSLVKLSDQLAGAEDEIHLSRDQVSFWENLRDDGKVVQAIKGNKK